MAEGVYIASNGEYVTARIYRDPGALILDDDTKVPYTPGDYVGRSLSSGQPVIISRSEWATRDFQPFEGPLPEGGPEPVASNGGGIEEARELMNTFASVIQANGAQQESAPPPPPISPDIPEAKESMTIELPQTLHQWLVHIADREERTPPQQAAFILRYAIKEMIRG